ncbi:MAG: ParB/RepB/Spo0J family partition protein [Leptolyngbya sp. PLA2]|nr:ParB/RepB/Spo0J family partition protein [Leptolyngbya sp.]MCE7971910.1 ParB/RepB/Spo0J family partition protein [Leptolyngbya sp. PL-A2]MCQ3939727.1 chromosome partitioning protein ParB [cyanobacterium CYA1]MDL1903983.1 ParB/RepB/Spo0J family partition protein [Synechococcales cyanobacterium CNB]
MRPRRGIMPAMSTKPRRLGRGLSSLLEAPSPVRIETQVPVSQDVTVGSGVVALPVDAVSPSPFQPRERFDDAGLAGLAESIRRSGVMQPIIVRPLGSIGGGARKYELVAGERRWRAARLAGLATVPALVRDLDDESAAEWAVVENVQREDLNPIERARALRGLAERFGLTHGEIADRVGLERSSVANLIRLIDLDARVQELIASGALTAGHGKALLAVADAARRAALAERAVRESWTVRRLEREARRAPAVGGSTAAQGGGTREAVIADLERRLTQHLGTKVTIVTGATGTRGRIVVEFYDLDHFDGLMTRMGLVQGK